jgi:hypothetical protein
MSAGYTLHVALQDFSGTGLISGLVTLALAAWIFGAEFYRTHKLEEKLKPRARISFDPHDSTLYVRRGQLNIGSEFRYLVGVINESSVPLRGLRIVLEYSSPDEDGVTYIGAAMGDRLGSENGVFTVNPGDGIRPTQIVDVLQEIVPSNGGPALIRFVYANAHWMQMNKFFTDRMARHVTFRLEGEDLPEAVYFRLLVQYHSDRRRYSVAEVA